MYVDPAVPDIDLLVSQPSNHHSVIPLGVPGIGFLVLIVFYFEVNVPQAFLGSPLPNFGN